jgi:anti-anti-sigma regulatory factor
VSADGTTVEHPVEVTIATVWGGAEYARVILRGHLDHHTGQRLRTELSAVLDTGARYLTVDLTDAHGCEESALEALDWAARRASSQQGWLALTGVNHHLRFAPERHRLRDR